MSALIGRMRVGLEGTHTVDLGASRALSPYWQLSARYDAGDGHNGAGLEVATGVRYATSRIEALVEGRWLAVRSGEAYEEFGATASLEFKPRSDGLGMAAVCATELGHTGWWCAIIVARAIMARPHRAAERSTAGLWSTDARIGYTLALPGVAAHLTPFGQFNLAGESSVRARTGIRLDRGDGQRSRMGIEAGLGLVEPPSGGGIDGAIDLSIEARF